MAGTLTISTLSDGTNSTSSTNCIQGSAKAWVQWTASGTIVGSYNVSSITYAATGRNTINFTTSLGSTGAAVTSAVLTTNGTGNGAAMGKYFAPTATSVDFWTYDTLGNPLNMGASVAVFR